MEYTREGYEALVEKSKEINQEDYSAILKMNMEINNYWQELRKIENAMTPEEIREKYLNTDIYVSNGRTQKRRLREDEKGLYVRLDRMKARVSYNPVFKTFKIDHFE